MLQLQRHYVFHSFWPTVILLLVVQFICSSMVLLPSSTTMALSSSSSSSLPAPTTTTTTATPITPTTTPTTTTTTVPIIACSSSMEVQRAISRVVQSNDYVLDIGCQFDDTTITLCQTIEPFGTAIVVDVDLDLTSSSTSTKSKNTEYTKGTRHYHRSSKIKNKSGRCTYRTDPQLFQDNYYNYNAEKKKDYDMSSTTTTTTTTETQNQQQQPPKTITTTTKIQHIQLSSLENWKEILFSSSSSDYDIICLDIGHLIGNDLYLTTLTLTNDIIAAATTTSASTTASSSSQSQSQPRQLRAIIVKSKSLASLARRLRPAHQIIQQHQQQQQETNVIPSSSLPLPLSSSASQNKKHQQNQQKQQPIIIATVGVHEYRSMIPYTVQFGNTILEVGCHLGRTTSLLHQAATTTTTTKTTTTTSTPTTTTATLSKANHHNIKKNNEDELKDDDKNENNNDTTTTTTTTTTTPKSCYGGYCIGVDIGPKIIKRAQQEYPNLYFAVGDAWKVLDLLRLQQQHQQQHKQQHSSDSSDTYNYNLDGYNVIYVDIGGLSGPHGTLEALSLLESLSNALEPTYIVIKSLCLKRLASQLQSCSSLLSSSSS